MSLGHKEWGLEEGLGLLFVSFGPTAGREASEEVGVRGRAGAAGQTAGAERFAARKDC